MLNNGKNEGKKSNKIKTQLLIERKAIVICSYDTEREAVKFKKEKNENGSSGILKGYRNENSKP